MKGDIAAGDQFRVTRLHATCHCFSHVDAQAHILAGAPTIERRTSARVVGPARVLDLRDVRRTRRSAPTAGAGRSGWWEGEILLLSTAGIASATTTPAPSGLMRPGSTGLAAQWLADRKPTALAFDFPQDFPIRLLLDGGVVPFDQHVTHDVCLRQASRSSSMS